ncbi:MAG TPA: hypothetical protein VGL84_02195 [Gaiellaceae bacterium]
MTKTVTRTVTGALPVADQSFYGTIVSMTPDRGGGYLMRFDPAWFLSGVTANVLYAEDQHKTCAPRACEGVPDDYAVLEGGHRALTFLVPAGTRGTVLVHGVQGKTVSVVDLAKYVRQGFHAKIFEPLVSGVWIQVHIDTVSAFRQQYRP